MNKSFSLSLILTSLITNVFGQYETFYETVSIPYAFGRIYDMKKISDKNIILLVSNPHTPNQLMKVDTMGEIIWQKDLIRANNVSGFPYSVIQTSDSGYVSTSSRDLPPHDIFSIVRTDKMGNLLWAKQSEHENSNNVEDITPVENAGFVMVTDGCTWNDMVAKVDNVGNMLWKNQYMNYYQPYTIYKNIIHNNDQSLVIGGMTGNLPSDGLCLFSLDSEGNLLWYKTYQFPYSISLSSLMRSEDKGYTITGKLNPQTIPKYPFLFHTDSVGNFLWAKKYSHPLSSSSNDIIQLADNGYILTGNVSYTTDENVQMLNIKTDQDGNFIWGHSFGNVSFNGGGYDDLFCSEWISGNYFYVAGVGENPVLVKLNGISGIGSCSYDTLNYFTIPLSITQSEPAISIINFHRELDADTFSSIDNYYSREIICSTQVGVEEIPVNNDIVIFPNPFESITNIDFGRIIHNAKLEIFNVDGRLVKKVNNIYGNSLTLHRDNLPSGLFFFRILEYDKVILNDKILIVE